MENPRVPDRDVSSVSPGRSGETPKSVDQSERGRSDSPLIDTVSHGLNVYRMDPVDIVSNSKNFLPTEHDHIVRVGIAERLVRLDELEPTVERLKEEVRYLRSRCNHAWDEPDFIARASIARQGCLVCGEVRFWSYDGYRSVEDGLWYPRDSSVRPRYNSVFPPLDMRPQ